MESFLNRYRSITVLLLVIFAQLVLLAVQVKNDQDVRFIRLWTVTAVTPVARVVEWVRGGSIGFVRNYFLLRDAGVENRRLREEVGRLRMENNYLKNELSTAERAKALQLFQAHTPSRTLAANVIGIGAGANSKVVFVNRGSAEGVMRGMAVVTPDGIVGKVTAAYPTAAEVLLITAPEFAAGVMSQKQQARGTLKGQGNPLCKVDYVPFEEKVEPGEWFYTSGDDRIFPRGFQVGIVKSVRPSQPYKEILVEPSGLRHGLEDVLILISNVHQDIPDAPAANQPVYVAPPPPASPASTDPSATKPAAQGTEADRLRGLYKSVGDAQGHSFGEGTPGSKPPDFTKVGVQTPTAPANQPSAAPAAPGSQSKNPDGGRGTAPPQTKQQSAVPPAPGNRPLTPDAGRGAPAPQTKQQSDGPPASGARPQTPDGGRGTPPSPTVPPDSDPRPVTPENGRKQPADAPPAPGSRPHTPEKTAGPGRGTPR